MMHFPGFQDSLLGFQFHNLVLSVLHYHSLKQNQNLLAKLLPIYSHSYQKGTLPLLLVNLWHLEQAHHLVKKILEISRLIIPHFLKNYSPQVCRCCQQYHSEEHYHDQVVHFDYCCFLSPGNPLVILLIHADQKFQRFQSHQ